MAEHDHEPTAEPTEPAAEEPCMAIGADGIHEWGCVLTAGHQGPHSGVDGEFTWTDNDRP